MIDRSELHNKKGSSLMIGMFYIELYSELVAKFDHETAEQKLRILGYNVAKTYYDYYKPSNKSISGLVKELSTKVGGIKKIKLKKVEDGFTLSSPDCPLCLPEIEIEGPQYCIATCAILEQYLNMLFRDYPDRYPRYRECIGKVIRSRSSGSDECEYHFRLIER